MKFTDMPEVAQRQTIDFVNARWAQLHKLEEDWGEKVYKYLLLTNSGGAVALLSFLGSGKAPDILWAKVALASFVTALVVVGIAVARIYHRMAFLYTQYRNDAASFFTGEIERSQLYERDEGRSRKDSFWATLLPYTCFGLFIFGCVTGAYALFSSGRIAG